MKEYIKPNVEVISFAATEAITVSGGGDDDNSVSIWHMAISF